MATLRLKTYESLEKEIQSSILDYLAAKNVFCWKEHSGGMVVNGGDYYVPMGLTGKSDILGIYKGRFLAIEVKRRSGKLSEAQESFINRINQNGGLAFVAHSIDDVIAHGI